MTHFITKSAALLLIAFLCSSFATADSQKNCHFAFGSGVAEQVLVADGIPQNPYLGSVHLRIGRVQLEGTVDMVITGGFDVPSFNPAAGETRITGFGKATFDFRELGAFHTWEVDTSTLIGPPPWEYATLRGDIRTGPARAAVPTPGAPPSPWGSGFFTHTNATLQGLGWNHFAVLNQEGMLVNEFTYFLWGKICDVDLRGIRDAQRR